LSSNMKPIFIRDTGDYTQYNGRKRKKALYRCICGKEFETQIHHVNNGHTKSCGCYKINNPSHLIHGQARKGACTQTYYSWSSMLARCLNHNKKSWDNYGGRGINIDDPRWLEFDNFYEDMGDKPEGLTIERIDNNKGYSKENCRWATPLEQATNRRCNINVTYNDKTQCLKAWAQDIGIKYGTLYHRYVLNKKPIEIAFKQESLRKTA
jgi:hypothetical protein